MGDVLGSREAVTITGRMRFIKVLSTLVLSLAVPAAAKAADGWAHLKAGMSRSEAVAVLGAELIASKGRGFEVAIYDARAEVVFLRGQVVAWTAPATSPAAKPSAEAWQFEQTVRARANATSARRQIEARPVNGPILPAYRL